MALATDVEGIFRLSGSEKRIKELRIAFDSPDRYGKGLDWTGYTVHDAANILRRYFNQLPEPIIPLDFYERFRAPLRGHQEQAVGHIDGQSPSIGEFDFAGAIRTYQTLITELPPLNRQLLLYILDLLAVFASKSDLNKMTTPNLAAIFQPGILSHPSHDMAPAEYRLSQDVLIFLIENQDHFLIGMQGTGTDEKTVKEIQSGPPTPQARPPTTPGRTKTFLGRSASTSSAGAESVRRFGNIRRNLSVSSRHSRHSVADPGLAPASLNAPYASNAIGSGIRRSNTAPSKRPAGTPTPQFHRDKPLEPPTSIPGAATEPIAQPVLAQRSSPQSIPATPAPPATVQAIPNEPAISSIPSSEDTTPLAPPPNVDSSTGLISAHASEPQSEYVTPLSTPTPMPDAMDAFIEQSPPAVVPSVGSPRSIANIFSRSSASDVEKKDARKPNKLQKKRIPGSANTSAQNSAASLNAPLSAVDGPPSPGVPGTRGVPIGDSMNQSLQSNVEATPTKPLPATAGLKAITVSPTTSLRTRSTATDYSESDQAEGAPNTNEDVIVVVPVGTDVKEKKRRWRLSSTPRHEPERRVKSPSKADTNLGSNAAAGGSISSVNSAGNARKSITLDSQANSTDTGGTPPLPAESGNGVIEKESERRGPIGWLKGKMQERKEREAEKQRAKSPPNNGSDPSLRMQLLNPSSEMLAVRGKSIDVPREARAQGTSEGTTSTVALSGTQQA